MPELLSSPDTPANAIVRRTPPKKLLVGARRGRVSLDQGHLVAIPGTSLVQPGPPANNTDGIFDDLRAIQGEFGYLPIDKLQSVAEARGMKVRDVHAVASFYPHFHLKPRARVDVRVCRDMSCHLRGAGGLKQELEARLQTHLVSDCSVRATSCLGRCDAAPAVLIATRTEEQIYDGVNSDHIAETVSRSLKGEPLPSPTYLASPQQELHCDPYVERSKYGFLRSLVQTKDWAGVIAQLKASGLRGMGGAGFPTGTKWEAVRNCLGDEKYVICNADESEPGTIKDRFIMQHLPHLLIEGMIVAGLVAGAKSGILYIRHEYEHPKDCCQEEIDYCRANGLLGRNILGSELQFDLSIFVSPGGYICGEETALMEAIEGKRAEPRNKPPFPVFQGLWHKPTVLNNVETFALATVILVRGADWFKSYGRNGSAGIKFVGISGDVRNPGVFEVPMGTTYDELINGLAGGAPKGKTIKAFAPSGPSSGYLPASMLNLPLDWDVMSKPPISSMVGSGAIVVCSNEACMLDMALNSVTFYRNESCGKCVPCRVGSQKLVDMLSAWTEGKQGPHDLQMVNELTHALMLTSICGLGQILPAPIQSVMRHFREEVDSHLKERRCPAGVCKLGGTA
ncbi:MAG TPA: NAD(P)H-dependent oxidoreductase subunit E [Terriglobales bacterium]|nr:NAD(P)H-dependent oxidoreductase subunit E [Terriglobales bacterium]